MAPTLSKETIAAPATAVGPGGISVIRISGSGTLEVLKKLTGQQDFTHKEATYLKIKNPKDGVVIDDGVIVFYKSPKSFTGEDLAEVSLHGGYYITAHFMKALTGLGVKTAAPGEFTERAFLNGKIDLVKAEAVAELINAQSELSFNTARGHLDGKLSQKINEIKEELLTLVSHIEAELDFTEEEIDLIPFDEIKSRVKITLDKITELVNTYHDGMVVKEGLKTVILGRANVGKSSFFNLLLKNDRAIVTDIEGTTRDLLEELLNIKGLSVKLIDTAGLRKTSEKVELIGIRKARDKANEADIILYIIDLSSEDFNLDFNELKDLSEKEGRKKIFIILNKSDLVSNKVINEAKGFFSLYKNITLSVKNEEEIKHFEDAFIDFALNDRSKMNSPESAGLVVTTARVSELLEDAKIGLEKIFYGKEIDITRDLMSSDLRWSMDKLGEITGEVTTEDILGKIFSTFCVGK